MTPPALALGLLLVVTTFTALAAAVDVRDAVVDMGLADYSSGSRGPFARNPWDMAYYSPRGRVYIGQGNSDNSGSPNGNAGPIKMVSFVPGVTGSFLLEGAQNTSNFPEEQCDWFLHYNNSLFWGGHDPRISWTQRTTYRIDPPGTNPKWNWEQYISTIASGSTLDPNWGIHVYALNHYHGKLYSAGYSYGVSEDMGKTWAKLFNDGSRKYCFLTVRDKFFASLWSGVNELRMENGNMTAEITRTDFLIYYVGRYVLLPGIRITGRYQTYTSHKIVRPIDLPCGFAMFLAGLSASDHQTVTTDVFLARSLDKDNADVVRTTPAGERAWDLLLRGTTAYLLTSRTIITAGSVEQFVASVWKSTSDDYTAWTQVFSCSGLPTFARSFEEVNGDFYLGLGTDDGAPESTSAPPYMPIPEAVYTHVKPDSGRILWVPASAFAQKSVSETLLSEPAQAPRNVAAASNTVCSAAQAVTVPLNLLVNVTGPAAAVPNACWPTETMGRAKSMWFSIVGAGTLLRAYTCDSGVKSNTRLSVYTSCSAAGSCVAHNNDNDVCGTNSQQSSVMWFAATNVTYYLQLSSGSIIPGESLEARLRIATVTRATCTGNAIITTGSPARNMILPNSSYTTPFSSCSSRPSLPAGEWKNRAVSWFRVTGTGGRLRVTVSNSNAWIPAIEVRASCGGPASANDCVAFSDENSIMPVEWQSVSGTIYYIAVYEAFMSNTATMFNVTLSSSSVATNSYCSAARQINFTSSTYSLTADTTKAVPETLLDSCDVFSRDANAIGGTASLWYKMQGDGRLWTASTCAGSDSVWNAMLEVYDSCPTATTAAKCECGWVPTSSMYCGFLNTAAWFARPGKTYYLRLTSGFAKGAGSTTVSFSSKPFVQCSTAASLTTGTRAASNMSAVGFYYKAGWAEWKTMQVAWHRVTIDGAYIATVHVSAQRAVWIEIFGNCNQDGVPEEDTLKASGFGVANTTGTVSWTTTQPGTFWIAVTSLQSTTTPSTFDITVTLAAIPKSDSNDDISASSSFAVWQSLLASVLLFALSVVWC